MKKLLLLLLISLGLASFFYFKSNAETSSGFSTSNTNISPNFKVAFTADQGLSSNAEKVLDLIVAEGADLVVVSGDLGYDEHDPLSPRKWDSMMRKHLGDILYVGSIGNHDLVHWDMYQHYLEQRLNEDGITWSGDLGINSHLYYKGLFIVLSGVEELGNNHNNYIRESLAEDDSMWRVVSWHKNHAKMQVGKKGSSSDKNSTVKWPTYEISRKAGAIVANAHSHTYSRTYMLTNLPDLAGSIENPEYDESRGQNMINGGSSNPIILREGTEEGSNFVFVSGLGGNSIRKKQHNYDWMAETYTASEDSEENSGAGVLFITFHEDGQSNKARGYFKNIAGDVIDEFEIISELSQIGMTPQNKLYENGQIREEGNYKNGKKDGEWTEWYENGQIWKKLNFKDDKGNGKWTYWYEDGQIRAEGKIKDSKGNGKWTYWYENGQKREEGNYKNGKKDGEWTEWHEDGQKSHQGNYKNGKRDDKWKRWCCNEALIITEDYKDSELIGLIGTSLSGVDLSGKDLSGQDLSGVDLTSKDLTGIILSGVDLSGKDLTDTNLNYANLRVANLTDANLTGAKLIGSNLIGTNLSGVDLSGKDLTGSTLIQANLIGTNLSGVDLSGKDL
ncbi:pentapeptide repeat-containing protein, partial [Candidatus Pseudothioglobus singularis]|nr:pentapeptide repeat-containing protein [Candidatus Pseudothioglobus singularis]